MTTSLQYPWGDQLPPTAEVLRLLPGLDWIRMPLPFALDHINLWALADDETTSGGLTVVDTGVATPDIRAAWQRLWLGPLHGSHLTRVLVTHMHPDHVGNAQWLLEQFGAPANANTAPAQLWISATDYLSARHACQDNGPYGGEHAASFFESHGLDDPEGMAKVRQRGDYYAAMVPSLPASFHRLMDGMTVQIGARHWRCIAGYGHSPEHIALYNEADGVLISGDMLLPRISTNISISAMEPEADALGLFLASIERFRALPADTLVLPSHGRPFRGAHARIDALQQHHAERLDEVMDCARRSPITAAALLPVLFKRTLDLHQTTFAMGEAVAHLNHLWHQGQLRRERTPEGVWTFVAV